MPKKPRAGVYEMIALKDSLIGESVDDEDQTIAQNSAYANQSELDASDLRRLFFLDAAMMEHHDFQGNRVSTSKYNSFTFLPKFLAEQFRQYANMFFLLVCCLQQIPGVSPTGRWTTVAPLSFILALSAAKELLEDAKRKEADRDVNNSFVKVFREGTFMTMRWVDVKVGDVVKVLNDQFFPADLVLLSSSEPQGMCYIETANLDGETNLKIRQALPQTSHITSTREVRALRGSVECEGPNNRLYKFVGNICFTSSAHATPRTLPLSADQLLLRGAQLRNTPWVYGLVVYAGHETKLMRNNATSAPSKRSNVDRVTNTQILGLFFALIALSAITTVGNGMWSADTEKKSWYLDYGRGEDYSSSQFYNFLTFIILYNMVIPISLIVTVDMVKYCQALIFINSDLDMYHAKTDTPARAVTSQLNEELGQVEYIFSDKTGTLTRNVMQFLKCSIGGVMYGDTVIEDAEGDSAAFSDPSLLDNLTNGHSTASVIREWLTLLAVCHTVVPERDRSDPDTINYAAASPDEEALVIAVKRLGFSFNVRTPESVKINALGLEEKYQVLQVLEFNSTRKRMSVVVRCPNGAIKLYCKGADTVIYERLRPGHQPYADATREHLKSFAAGGLRTLCLAVTQLTEEQYAEWAEVYSKAATSMVDRDARLDEAAELIEQNLLLIGASAIEDKLQVGVPDTIQALANAGIKLWVLTGDKQETAINIGFACRLLRDDMKLLICNEGTESSTQKWITNTLAKLPKKAPGKEKEADEGLALIIDGAALTFALSQRISEDWLQLAMRCKAVVCCRVSPLQKAQIVDLVKSSCGAITLAIGDGANDVGMIQAAHVGVGISGMEGLQAARSADYAIAQFRYLEKLILCHGQWSYKRVTTLILYFFYKNFSLTFVELFYAFSNGFSGQVLYEKWMIAAFNVVFTLIPPLALGIFEQHLSMETLLAVPECYRAGQRGEGYNTRVFWRWTAMAAYHCTLLYFTCFAAMESNVSREDGLTQGHWYQGCVLYGILVYTCVFKAGLHATHWTVYTHIAIWGSCGLWFGFTAFYFNLFTIAPPSMDLAADVYGVFDQMMLSPSYYALVFLMPILALFVDYTILAFQQNFWPTLENKMRRKELAGRVLPPMRVGFQSKLPGENASRGAEHLGFAFSQADNTTSAGSSVNSPSKSAISQADMIRKYDTNDDKPEGL